MDIFWNYTLVWTWPINCHNIYTGTWKHFCKLLNYRAGLSLDFEVEMCKKQQGNLAVVVQSITCFSVKGARELHVTQNFKEESPARPLMTALKEHVNLFQMQYRNVNLTAKVEISKTFLGFHCELTQQVMQSYKIRDPVQSTRAVQDLEKT